VSDGITKRPPATPLPDWAMASRVLDVSSRGIASYVAELIRTGGVAHGEFLPQVRVLSRELRVSPATVSAAWGLLKKRGLLVGTGKSGIRVASAVGFVQGLEVYATAPGTNDLRLIYPDLDLLPALDRALMGAARQPNLNEYYDPAILPGLQRAIEPSWPAPAEAFAVANGGADAVWSVLQSNSVPGDRVVIESPTQPQLISLMLDLGLTLVPVPYRDGGLDLRALREALATRPVAIFFQPRAHVPTGWSTSRQRAREIAESLRGPHKPLVIEYDDLGALTRAQHHSVAEYLPEQTVVIRSYEKSYGPDLRLAVIGAATPVIRNTHSQIRLTRQWTSRILQAALQWMLQDDGTAGVIDTARHVYAERLDTFARLLRDRGIAVTATEGFCLWVPVIDETATATELAARGVVALRGASSFPGDGTPHIRIATSRVPVESMPQLADIIASCTGRFA